MRMLRMHMPGSMAFPRNTSYLTIYPTWMEKKRLDKIIAAGRDNLYHNDLNPEQYILRVRKSVRKLYEVLLDCDLK